MASMRWAALPLLVLTFAAAPALATSLGDQAPALKIDKWVKGDAVELSEGKGDHIYVVEFWATWCGPCRMTIPHLTKLQEKYKDKGVRIIGVSDEDASTVQKFVEQQGDKMDYTVAVDKERATYKAYMEAFNQRGIPHAFIVDKSGKLIWHGHPASMDGPLEEIVKGKFDLATYREREKLKQKAEAQMQEYALGAIMGSDKARLDKLSEQIMDLLKDEPDGLNAIAWFVLTNEQIENRDVDFALRAATRANELTEGKSANIVDTYARALWETGKKKQAIAHQKKAIKLAETDEEKDALQKTLAKYQGDLRE